MSKPNIVLDEGIETLGSQLKRAGYATTWIGKSHLGGWFEPHDEPTCPHSTCEMTDMGYQLTHHPGGAGGEDHVLKGFDNWISGWTDYRNYLQTTDLPDEIKNDRWVGGHAVMETGLDSEHSYSRLTAQHHMAHWMAQQAVEVINHAKASQGPFCVKLAFYAPHHPVAPPKPYDTMYSPEDIELPDSYFAAREEIFEDVFNRGYMTRKGQWKFVLNAGLTGGNMVRKLDELHDLQNDPYEMRNLAYEPEYADRVKTMKERVLQWLEESGHPYAAKIREAAELPVEGGK